MRGSNRVAPGGGWRRVAWVGLLMLAGAQSCLAVNKCIGADGRVTYTDGACGGGSRVERIETPPPLTRDEQAAARFESERVLREAQALDARKAQEAAESRRLEADRRRAEAQERQRQAEREAAELQARMAVTPVYALPIYPSHPYYHRPPLVVPPRPPAQVAPAPPLMRSYPFR